MSMLTTGPDSPVDVAFRLLLLQTDTPTPSGGWKLPRYGPHYCLRRSKCRPKMDRVIMTFLSIAVDTAAGADPVAAAVAGVPAAAAAVSALPPRADHNKILYFVVFLFF